MDNEAGCLSELVAKGQYGFLLLLLLVITRAATAEIPVRNYNPFALMVGLPELKSAFLLPAHSRQMSITSTISNQWNIASEAGETIFVDGEVNITDVNFSYGFSNWALTVNIPWIAYQRGSLDPLIEGFHQNLSMPNGGREYFYQNQLLFIYSNEQTQQSLRIDKPVSGVGDVRINLAAQVKRSDVFASSIGIQLKLANGDAEQWLGSDSYDIAVYNNFEWLQGSWQTQFQLALVMMQDAGFLQGQREKLAGALSLAVNYNMTSQLWWSLQYDMHTALFTNSNIASLSDSQMMSMAIAWRGKSWGVHFAMLEDVVVASAPDVGFQLGFNIKL